MRTLAVLLLAVLLSGCRITFAQVLPAHQRAATPTPASGASPTYIIEEYAEGTGTPSGWTDGGSAPNWDYTTTALQGAQSVRTGGSGGSTFYTIPDANFYEAVVQIRFDDTTQGGSRNVFSFLTSAAGAVCMARINASGQLMVFANGSDSTATTDAMADATTYFIKLIWNDSGTCSAEFSSTSTFTGSGNAYTSKTGGTTTDCTRFYIGSPSSSTVNTIFDSIKVDDAVIGP